MRTNIFLYICLKTHFQSAQHTLFSHNICSLFIFYMCKEFTFIYFKERTSEQATTKPNQMDSVLCLICIMYKHGATMSEDAYTLCVCVSYDSSHKSNDAAGEEEHWICGICGVVALWWRGQKNQCKVLEKFNYCFWVRAIQFKCRLMPPSAISK